MQSFFIKHRIHQISAFPDINPSADIHILIVPREHIGGIADLNESHGKLLTEIYKAVNQLVKSN
ncbi:MAG: HIT domain-containing protein, partial [Ignavibacteriae bacterium]|nr:HIT domain-containing protein [Ignavibacteriota bacterium]